MTLAAPQVLDWDPAAANLGGWSTWDTTTPVWWSPSDNQMETWQNGDIACFQGTSGTVTVPAGSQISAASIVLDGNYTVQGPGELSLPFGGTTIDVEAASASIDAIITGGGSLTKQGSGALTLSGANTYTGGSQIAAGAVALAGATPLGTGTVDLAGGTLQFVGVAGFCGAYYNVANNGYVPDFTGLTPVATRADATIDFPNDGNGFEPGISGLDATDSGAVWTGVLNITAGGSYTFQTTSDDGSLLYVDGTEVVNDDGPHGMQTASGTIDLTAGNHLVTVQYAQAGGGAGIIAQYSGADTGNAMIDLGSRNGSVSTGGPLDLSNALSVTADSSVQLPGSGGPASLASLAIGGQTLHVVGSGTLAVSGAVSLAGSGSATFDVPDNATLSLDGVVSGDAGLTKAGAGRLVLAAANNYDGTTNVIGGTLQALASAGTGGTNTLPGDVSLSSATLRLSPSFGTAAVAGFYGAYYNVGNDGYVPDFSGLTPVATRDDATIDFPNDGNGFEPGISGLNASDSGAVWTGLLNITSGGSYAFQTTSDDGSLLYVDGQEIVNDDGPHGMQTATGSIDLTPGCHVVTIDYAQAGGGAGVIVQYSGADTEGAMIDLGSLVGTVSNVGGSFASVTMNLANNLSLSGASNLDLDLSATSSGTLTAADGSQLTLTTDTTAGYGLQRATFTQAGAATLAGSLTIDTTAADASISGNIGQTPGGVGSLVEDGGGTLVLAGTNSYGDTTVLAGTLQVGDGGDSGTLGTGAVLDDGALVFNRSGTMTAANAISGSGSLTQSGTGTLVLAGANSYGQTTVSAGTLQVGSGGQTGTLGTGAVLDNGTLVFDRSDTFTVPNAISGSGDLTQVGSGTLVLTGANSYANTTVSAGTLQVGDGGDSGTLGTGAVLDDGTLAFDRSDTFTVANTISGSGSLSEQGSGVLTLSGANTYTGGTQIAAGAVALAGATPLGAGPVDLAGGTLQFSGAPGFSGAYYNVANDGHVPDFSGLTPVATRVDATIDFPDDANGFEPGISGLNTTDSGAVWTGMLSITSGGSYTFQTTSDDGSLLYVDGTQVVNDDGAHPMQTATGTIDLGPGNHLVTVQYAQAGGGAGIIAQYSGADTGGAMIDLGSLASTVTFGGTISLPNAVNVTAESSIQLSGGSAASLASLAIGSQTLHVLGSGTVTVVGAATLAGPGPATFDVQSGATLAFDGVISGDAGLTKTEAGMMVLAAANTYGGATTILDGTLGLDGGVLPASTAVEIGGGATLDLGGSSQTIASLADAAPGATVGEQVLLGGGTLTVGDDTSTTFSGVISGSGGLTKTGSGTLTLANSETYTGTTTISAGTLQLGDGLANNGSLAGDILDNATLVVADSGAVTLPGIISGSGSLVQQGPGVLSLTGTNTYSGGTQVTAGTVALAGATPLGTGAIDLAGGTLQFIGTPGFSGSYYNVQNGGYVPDFTGLTPVATRIDATIDFPDDPNGFEPGISGLNTTESGAVWTGLLHVSTGGFYTFQTTSDDGSLLYVDGTQVVNDDGAHPMQTATGTIDLATGNHLVTVQYVQAGAGAGIIAQYSGADTQGTMIDLGSLPGTVTSGGTISLPNAVSVTAASSIQLPGCGGTLNLPSLAIGGQVLHVVGQGTVAVAGAVAVTGTALPTFDVQGGATLAFGGVVSGDAGLTKAGVGTLVLAAANTYSGTTNLLGGTLGLDGGTLPASTSVEIAGGATLDLDGSSQTIAALADAVPGATTGEQVLLGGGTLTVGDDTSTTFSGVISGSGGLTKTGSGTLVLGNSETYTGTTTISAGTLHLGDGSASDGSLAGDILDNAALVVADPGAVTLPGAISGSGSLSKQGGGLLTLTGMNTYSGGTQIAAGSVALASPMPLGSGSVDLAGGTLQFTGAAGFYGAYYNVTNDGNVPNFAGLTPVATRADATIDFPDNGNGFEPGISGLNTANSGAVWTGLLNIASGGFYNFQTTSDDGSLVYVDGVQAVNDNGSHPMQTASGGLDLASGYHLVTIQYAQAGGGAGIIVQYSGADTQGAMIDLGSLPGTVTAGVPSAWPTP